MLEQRLIENLIEFETKIEFLKKQVNKDLRKYRKEKDEEAISYCRGYIHALESITNGLQFYFDKAVSEHKIDQTIELNPSVWMN